MAAEQRPLSDLVHPEWAEALAPVEPNIRAMGDFLRTQVAEGKHYLPAGDAVFRAFREPLSAVKVLLIGQDPYPTPGHAVGLSFSVNPDVRPIPRSLQNIYRELTDDIGCPVPSNGDLTPWTAQGVMLLNRVLTVEPRSSGAHRRRGWEAVTDAAVTALAARGTPLVAILWGRDAQAVTPLLGQTPIIAGVHPSPMSADRGFFGSRPFSRANALLTEQGADPIDWSLA